MLQAGDLSARQSEQNKSSRKKTQLMFGMVNYVQDSGNILRYIKEAYFDFVTIMFVFSGRKI